MERPLPPVTKVLQLLHSIDKLPRALETYLTAFLEVRSYQPQEFLLRCGDVCTCLSFITEGLMQVFPDEPFPAKASNHCSWFLMEGDMAICAESFFGRMPSAENIQALEPTTVVSITYDNLQDVYDAFPDFNYHGRIVTQSYYIKAMSQLKALRYKKAADTYRYLQVHCPNLVERIPARHLSGYLGVNEREATALKRHKAITE